MALGQNSDIGLLNLNTVLYLTIVDSNDVNSLQNDLNNIVGWCEDNFMSLNSAKCKFMNITRSRKLLDVNYCIKDQILETVKCYQYLGFSISHDLSWANHVRSTVAKCSKLCGFIRRTVNSRNPVILKKLFCSLCRPILEYGVPVWLPHQKNHIAAIEAVQRRFTRFCFSFDRANSLSYHERLIILKMPPLYNRMIYLSICLVVKSLHGLYDMPYDTLPKPSVRRSHILVFNHELARTNCLKYSLLHMFPRVWNSLPRTTADLCVGTSVRPFLNALCHFLFDLPPICQPF